MDRRKFLKMGALGVAAAMAGCTIYDDDVKPSEKIPPLNPTPDVWTVQNIAIYVTDNINAQTQLQQANFRGATRFARPTMRMSLINSKQDEMYLNLVALDGSLVENIGQGNTTGRDVDAVISFSSYTAQNKNNGSMKGTMSNAGRETLFYQVGVGQTDRPVSIIDFETNGVKSIRVIGTDLTKGSSTFGLQITLPDTPQLIRDFLVNKDVYFAIQGGGTCVTDNPGAYSNFFNQNMDSALFVKTNLADPAYRCNLMDQSVR